MRKMAETMEANAQSVNVGGGGSALNWKICAHCGKPFQGPEKRIVCDECLQGYWSRNPRAQ
ncbi:MAG: hypothetical protein QW542_04995 [Thermoproteota archaeon]